MGDKPRAGIRMLLLFCRVVSEQLFKHRTMKKLILITVSCFASLTAYPQGCIPIRNIVGFGNFSKPEYDPLNGKPTRWVLNVSSRYLKIAQTYQGSSRADIPPEDERINETITLNLGVTRILNNGWSASLDVPFAANARTTWQEHDPTNPEKVHHTVHSYGLGDVRVTVYKWLLDSKVSHRGNIQLGFGLKLPTGNYRYKDDFHKASGKVHAPVNATIQLGDGGLGVITELNTFYSITKVVGLYANGFYLLNPRGDNGVTSIDGGGTPSQMQTQTGDDVTSVPDAYTARAGSSFTLRSLTFWAGARIEGQPTEDLIGESNGTRRAGRIISVEPGVNYKFRNTMIYLYVPVPVYKKTQQTVADRLRSELTGTYFVSPGGFANYLIFVGVLFKI